MCCIDFLVSLIYFCSLLIHECVFCLISLNILTINYSFEFFLWDFIGFIFYVGHPVELAILDGVRLYLFYTVLMF